MKRLIISLFAMTFIFTGCQKKPIEQGQELVKNYAQSSKQMTEAKTKVANQRIILMEISQASLKIGDNFCQKCTSGSLANQYKEAMAKGGTIQDISPSEFKFNSHLYKFYGDGSNCTKSGNTTAEAACHFEVSDGNNVHKFIVTPAMVLSADE